MRDSHSMMRGALEMLALHRDNLDFQLKTLGECMSYVRCMKKRVHGKLPSKLKKKYISSRNPTRRNGRQTR